ncbi:MAG TPA: arabinan endo-1,5-alpha-L-arabinosidase [Fimbriimonas sp.]
MLLSFLAMSSILLRDPVGQDGSVFPGDGAAAVGSEHVHDPTLLEIGGKYFIFQTSGDGFTMVRSSKDLKTWKAEGPILSSQPEWLQKRYRHRSVWAPDVIVVPSGTGAFSENPHPSLSLGERVIKLRMYYSVSEWGQNKSVIGLAECDKFDPERPLEGWVDRGLVLESRPGVDRFNAIDAETIIDEEGRHWMYFGSYWSGIHVVELDPGTGMIKSGAGPSLPNPSLPSGEKGAPVLVAANPAERGNPLEGAAVVRRDGFYYLFVSYGLAAQGVRSSYRIMAGRSKSPTGPFLDREGKSMAEGGHVSVLKGSPPMFAPGHCDVLRLRDGRYVMPYHFYDGRKHWVKDTWGMPTLQIRELLWSQEGWPLPGLPLEMGISSGQGPREAKRPRAVLTPKGTFLHQADFGEPRFVEFREGGVLRSGSTQGSWKVDGEEVVLSWPREEDPKRPWVDRVQLAYGGRYYVGRTAAGLVVRGFRAGAK